MPHDLPLSVLQRCFTDDDGTLPDGTAVGSTEQDWPSVVELVRSTGWRVQWADVPESTPGMSDDGDHLRLGSTLGVWPLPEVRINLFPGEDVSFDFDRREIRDEAAARALGDFIRRLGTRLGREIAVAHEGRGPVFLRYDPLSDDFTFSA